MLLYIRFHNLKNLLIMENVKSNRSWKGWLFKIGSAILVSLVFLLWFILRLVIFAFLLIVFILAGGWAMLAAGNLGLAGTLEFIATELRKRPQI